MTNKESAAYVNEQIYGNKKVLASNAVEMGGITMISV